MPSINNRPSQPTPSTRPSTPATSTVVARPDPLATTRAGTGFKPVDAFGMQSDVNRALALGGDVPGRIQDGPTCGLYALGMVMDFWDKKNGKNLNPLVQSSDVMRWDSHSRPEDTNKRLLDTARSRGYTTQGEMFYASQLGALAGEFGYETKVKTHFTVKDLHRAVDQGHPVLVPFDVDDVGNPGLFNGKRAHWAVIEGHFSKNGVEYLVATHGWTGKEYVWKADEFMQSVNQLNTSDFPAAPRDITKTLRGRMVEVFPKA
jgi:hypothetical protein